MGDFDGSGSSGVLCGGDCASQIIPQGQIAGTDPLLNISGMDIPADHTEREAGAKLTDVRFFGLKKSGNRIRRLPLIFYGLLPGFS